MKPLVEPYRTAPCLTHFRTHPMRFLALAVAVSSLASAVAPVNAAAQQPTAPAPAVGPTLSLADAIAIARRSNPGFQTTLNSRRTASLALRSTNAAIIPTVSSSFTGDYREGKQQIVQGQAFGSTNNTFGTSGGVNANFNLQPGFLNDRRAARSNVEATEADIAGGEQTLRTTVITQFIAVLQAQANALLQDTLLITTTAQLDLARAKLQVGTSTQLDVDRAEVTNGTQRVAVLRARNQVDISKLQLFQVMGVEPTLSTRLEPLSNMQLPTQTLPELLDMARKSNPVLEAARAREEQANYTAKSARSSYLPSFSLSSGVGGYTNRFADTDALITSSQASAISSKASCIRSEEVRAALNLSNNLALCNNIAFTSSQESAIRESQSKYPFGFTRNGYGLNASLSLPIFNGFRREQNIEQAKLSRRNAQNSIRTTELTLGTEVNTAWLNLITSQQAVQIQEQNAATARRALLLAQERYKVGTISLVELIQSRGDFNQAETSRINAIYDFQRAFAQLEAAVGRPLR